MTLPMPTWRPLVRVVGMLGVLACLAACTTAPLQAPTGGAATAWSGRLSLRVDSDPPQSYSAGFELRGSPERGELLLHSPLGHTLAAARWNAAGAEWQQGDQVYRRATLDELASALGGSTLPVAALFDWLQGRAREAGGWQADLSRQPDGRVVARRLQPLPTAELRLIFER
jgi:outer membrane lipoprotein LolB